MESFDAEARTRQPDAVRSPPRLQRVDFPCDVGGFPTPPCPVHLRFEKTGGRWTIWGLTPPGWPPSIARWLEPFKPTSIRISPGLFPRVLQVEFETMPLAWEPILSSLKVHSLELTTAGMASLFVIDSPDKIAAFVRTIASARSGVRVTKALEEAELPRLTSSEIELLFLRSRSGPTDSSSSR